MKPLTGKVENMLAVPKFQEPPDLGPYKRNPKPKATCPSTHVYGSKAKTPDLKSQLRKEQDRVLRLLLAAGIDPTMQHQELKVLSLTMHNLARKKKIPN